MVQDQQHLKGGDQKQDGSVKDLFVDAGNGFATDLAQDDAGSEADSDASIILSSQKLSLPKSGKKKRRRKSQKLGPVKKPSKAPGSPRQNGGHRDGGGSPDDDDDQRRGENTSEAPLEPLRLPRLNLAKVFKTAEFSLPKEFTSLKLEHTRTQVFFIPTNFYKSPI